MAEAIFAGALIVLTLRWIFRSAHDPNRFVRGSSRGAFMRDLNRKMMEEQAAIEY